MHIGNFHPELGKFPCHGKVPNVSFRSCATGFRHNLKSFHGRPRSPAPRMALEMTRMLHSRKAFLESDTIPRKVPNVPFRSCGDDSRQNLKSFHDTGKFPMCHLASELRFPADSVKSSHNIGFHDTGGGVRYLVCESLVC